MTKVLENIFKSRDGLRKAFEIREVTTLKFQLLCNFSEISILIVKTKKNPIKFILNKILLLT